METRVNFLRIIIYERAKNRALATVYYEDTGNGEHSNQTFDENGHLKDFSSSIAYNQNIFVDGSFNSLNIKSAKYNIFGYSKGDNITISKNANDIYAELGEGSDTITTGSGNDTIYTNADIDDEFDKETNSIVNTVNSGEGDDTIGQGVYENELKNLIKSLNLENKIKLVGYVNNPWDYINSSNLQVLFSRLEGFSLALIEGIYYGKMVFALDTANHKEVLGDDFIVQNDDEIVARKLNEVYENYDFYKTKFEKIKENSQKYSIENVANKYIKAYESLIK